MYILDVTGNHSVMWYLPDSPGDICERPRLICPSPLSLTMLRPTSHLNGRSQRLLCTSGFENIAYERKKKPIFVTVSYHSQFFGWIEWNDRSRQVSPVPFYVELGSLICLTTKNIFFWDVTPYRNLPMFRSGISIFKIEGFSIFLRNIGKPLPDCTASYPMRTSDLTLLSSHGNVLLLRHPGVWNETFCPSKRLLGNIVTHSFAGIQMAASSASLFMKARSCVIIYVG